MVLSRLHACKSIYCNLSVLSNGDNSSFDHLLLFIYLCRKHQCDLSSEALLVNEAAAVEDID